MFVFVASVGAVAGGGSECLGCAGFICRYDMWAVAQAWVYILLVSWMVSYLGSKFFLKSSFVFPGSLVNFLYSAVYFWLLISWVWCLFSFVFVYVRSSHPTFILGDLFDYFI